MKLKLLLTLILIYMLAGCSNSNAQNVAKPTSEDGYELVRKAAWDFIQDNGWSEPVKEDWQSAKVELVKVDENYEMLDSQYVGKEVAAVSFQDKENVVIGTPLILVDLETKEVVGYMPSE
jgi:nitrous oxide reductase accessory protein NosL